MRRIAVFLAVTFALTWAYEFGVVYPLATGGLSGIPSIVSQFAVGAAMFFPAIGVVVTRLVTREGFRNNVIKPRPLRRTWPWFALAWLGIPLLMAAGAAVYFLVFPQDFDPSMQAFVATQMQAVQAAGTDTAAAGLTEDTLRLALLAQLPVALLTSPVLNIFTTFGEEWGWRGYLMPKMAARMRIVPTMLATGVIWGLWHAPLIAIGHNYGTGYAGWPFAGIAAMCVFCTVTGIILSYVTIRTGSCLAAAIGHGALNGFAQAALFFSVTGGNPFVGPLSTGLLGGLPLIALAAWMLWDMRRREKAGTLEVPKAGRD